VYRTSDAGASWELAANGLPDRAWAAVLREGCSFDEGNVYFGTQSGSVWTAPASVVANAAPASGRVLLGTVQVRTDTNILIGSGDVVVQNVTP